MTRILHVLDHSLPLHSGYTFRTRAIMRAQAAAGLEVRGITGQRHNAEDGCRDPVRTIDGLTFYRTPPRKPGRGMDAPGLRDWRDISSLARGIEGVARDWRPDVLHAHSPAMCGEAAIAAGRRLGLPVVYEIRAFWEDASVGNGTGHARSLKYRLTRALENHVVERADAVFTICNGLRDDLVARPAASAGWAGKIGISPNGVDMGVFGAPVPRDDALALELGIADDAPVIGFIGSFYDYEGLDDLVAALPAIRREHPGTKLLLVGGGPRDAALRARAAVSPAPGAVIFTGRVPHEEVERYYSLIDILAYPRKRSRLTDLVTPLKPLEAMAQGRLVAASDVGGHRELVEDGVSAVLFPPDDPAGAARVLGRMLANRANWPAMQDAARQHVSANHDWAANIQRYQSVYQHLLARFPHPAIPVSA